MVWFLQVKRALETSLSLQICRFYISVSYCAKSTAGITGPHFFFNTFSSRLPTYCCTAEVSSNLLFQRGSWKWHNSNGQKQTAHSCVPLQDFVKAVKWKVIQGCCETLRQSIIAAVNEVYCYFI